MFFTKYFKRKDKIFDVSLFNPILIKKDNNFYIHQPELSIGGEGSTLEEAYKQYNKNLQILKKNIERYGPATIIPEPYPLTKNRSIFQELSLFFLKSVLSVIAVILIVVALLPNINAAFRSQVSSFFSAELKQPKYWAIQLPTHINNQLDRLNMEEEEKMFTEWNKLKERTSVLLNSKDYKCD